MSKKQKTIKEKIGIKDNYNYISIEPNPVISIYRKGITLKIYNHFRGYNLFFKGKGNKSVSAIFHNGSYGSEDGLWEVMPSRNKKESVEGYLTFEEVIKFVNKHLKCPKK